MAFDPLSAAFELGKTAIEKIWPDPTKRAQELRLLEELRQKGDLAELNAHVQLMVAQLEVNKVEAAHKSIFVAGWRPAVGWISAIALAVAFIPKAIMLTIMWSIQCYMIMDQFDPSTGVIPGLPPFPELGLMDILGILGGMLGMGTMRSMDKKNKVQTDNLGS